MTVSSDEYAEYLKYLENRIEQIREYGDGIDQNQVKEWIQTGNFNLRDVIKFQVAITNYHINNIPLPAHWHGFAAHLIGKAVVTVIDDPTAGDSAVARAMGISKFPIKDHRNFVIALAVRWRISKDTKRKALQRACIEVSEKLRESGEKLSWTSIRDICHKEGDLSELDVYIPFALHLANANSEKNPTASNYFRLLLS